MYPIIKTRPARRGRRAAALAILTGCLSMASHADTLADIYQLALKNDPALLGATATYRANLEPEKQALAQLLRR